MPFFIATSYRNLVQDVIEFVDAGPDQQLICDAGATLTATVGGDLSGRTIVWEQVSGSPVSFTTPVDQLTVSFSQFDFDDKTFRFTVDKNLSSESFDEITTFGTPTNRAPQPALQLSTTSFIRSPVPVADLVVALEPQPQTRIYYQDLSNPELVWIMPETTSFVVGFDIEVKVGGGVWTTEAVASPSSRVYIPLYTDPNAVYRVVAKIKTPNTIFQSPSSAINRELLQDGVFVINDHTAIVKSQSSNVSSMNSFTTDTLKLVKRAPDVDATTITLNQSQNTSTMTSFTTETLKLVIKPPVEIQTHISSNQHSSLSQILNFTVEDLTGGSVGG